jgi:hypothetical protein
MPPPITHVTFHAPDLRPRRTLFLGSWRWHVDAFQNGKAAGVLLSPAQFDALTERARFVAAIDEGLADVEGGIVKPFKEERVLEVVRRVAG